jgi:hypothetical protein
VNLSSPHGGEPVEDLDSGGNGNGHRRQHKEVLPAELMPTVNMWWAQTLMLINPMQTVAATMTG